MSYFVYMLAGRRNGTLYVGVTNDLLRRSGEHKEKHVPGFTKRHGVEILVWYEIHDDINQRSLVKSKLRVGTGPGSCG
jgi:putative endonuclease